MVTYCLGNAVAKRKTFLKSNDGVIVDNDEVLAVYYKKGKEKFVLGEAPFSNFTVWEYLSYTNSLISRHPLNLEEIKDILSKVGLKINPKRKIKHLDRVSCLGIRLASKIMPETKKIYINLDGLKYSIRMAKKLKNLLNSISAYEIMLAVSDSKFVPVSEPTVWFYNKEPVV